MTREEAERVVDSYTDSMFCGSSENYALQKQKLIAALCREPNMPEGEGRYRLTIEVIVSKARRSLVPYGNTEILEAWTAQGDECLGFTKEITGYWQKVEER